MGTELERGPFCHGIGGPDSLLDGISLGSRFRDLYNVSTDRLGKDENKLKKKKKGKIKPKEKSKAKETTLDTVEHHVPEVELHGNPSSFAVFTSVRQSMLEDHIKKISRIYLNATRTKSQDSDSEDEAEVERSADTITKIPKIVAIGLCGVLELIRETQFSNPGLCIRALQVLLDMLQGQQPEGLRNEPADVIDSLYRLLMDLSQSRSSSSSLASAQEMPECETLTALACAGLLSLVIARGDTGKLLTAIATMFMLSTKLATQEIKLPLIITSLQRSVHAALIGRVQLPTWLNLGIPEKCRLASAALTDSQATLPVNCSGPTHASIASDGKYLYIHNGLGLTKVGSGYGNTIMGYVYAVNAAFRCKEPSWLSVAKGKLLYKLQNDTSGILTVINTETLQPINKISLDAKSHSHIVTFSDGDEIGYIVAFRDDSFIVRTFDPFKSSVLPVNELQLKLARKCFDVFGSSLFDSVEDIHSIDSGTDEDAVSIISGKDFALMRTFSGKILYTGKSQMLGIKPPAVANVNGSKWAELPIIKSPKIAQYSIGHEGYHGLMVAEDGGVFFVGMAKRGEDGDTGSLSKARRPAVKAVKPKKMIRLEGKYIVHSACNSGTSALVTREGEVYMFGKDTLHCDHSTGLLADIKGVEVVSVALGKAHGVLLTKKGQIYTLGLNNRGQCGREFISGGGAAGGAMAAAAGNPLKETSIAVTMADEEEEVEEESACPPGKHHWKHEQCMICTYCFECTGYGSTCINSGRADRNPGEPCGCGSGDSGCQDCGVCRACGGEIGEHRSEAMELSNGMLMDALSQAPEPIPYDLVFGRGGVRQRGVNRVERRARQRDKVVKKNVKPVIPSLKAAAAVADVGAGSDHELDAVKLTSLPPGRLEVGNGDLSVIQVACGLHHTVLLMDNGDVFTFGSNQYGQLGLGDTVVRGIPTRVPLISAVVKQVAAGSNHTVLLAATGQVYTFGSHKKGQLGRPVEEEAKERKSNNSLIPLPVPGIGAKHGRRATWIGASGDQTFLRVDESLINVHTLSHSNIIANSSCIGVIPTVDIGRSNVKCLMINRQDGSCRSFAGADQVSLIGKSVCMDPVYDVIWSYDPTANEVVCYNMIGAELYNRKNIFKSIGNVLSPELAVPFRHGQLCSRSHCAMNILGCLDTLALVQQLNLSVAEEDKDKQTTATAYAKEDYMVVNRFDSHGGGWGYSGHSIEAIRFVCDTDILLGGFGLFGGRGEYFAKIKLFGLGPDSVDNEPEGELLAETEEMPYRCPAREKYAMLFDEPVPLQANHWYAAWARISGPSSDCGSSGQGAVVTDDQVTFKFKSSKKSNNGTDANAGQIPQLLFRLVCADSGMTGSISRKTIDQPEQVHILSREFSQTLSPECFESLMSLLSWSWNTFCSLGSEVQAMKGKNQRAAMMDLEQLIYISGASLRLIRTYIHELYPWQVKSKSIGETPRLAECIGEVRLLLRQILSESGRYQITSDGGSTDGGIFNTMKEKILEECHRTFTACFHAFYPTGNLKWICLCELLTSLDMSRDGVSGSGRLLAAVMEAMCHPANKLTMILPINCEHGTEQLLCQQQQQKSTDDNTRQGSLRSETTYNYPMLVGHMMHRTEMELVGRGHWTFKDILDKLLYIAGLPIRQAIDMSKCIQSNSLLVSNACSFLVTLICELSAAATGTEVTVTMASRPLLSTPNRFSRTSQGTYWNSGNGSPDAVCFSVNRPGIVVAGVGLYGGAGSYEYELELLDDTEKTSDPSPNGRWNSLEIVKGTYGSDDCVNDIAEIKFNKPIPIKENVKYALKLKNRGNRSRNGDEGMAKVKCSDGTVFSFCACSMSNNGTNHTRGQIPIILYYSSPQDGDSSLENSRSLAECQARKNTMNVVCSIFKMSTELFQKVHKISDARVRSIVDSSPLVTTLLPMVSACVGPVATMDPTEAVQILSLVQEILSPVASLNCAHNKIQNGGTSDHATELNHSALDGNTNSMVSASYRHYAIIESDHPYRPATVSSYVVTFPESVHWMLIDFDPQCGTAQPEDYLQLYIPERSSPGKGVETMTDLGSESPVEVKTMPETLNRWCPVLRKFHGGDNWPSMSLVLPGNEVCFSLETASNYIKDEKAYSYGFKCQVIGCEWPLKQAEGLVCLEQELAKLGGMCAESLMKKDIVLPLAVDDGEDDLSLVEDAAEQVFKSHTSLLSKGFSLLHMPTITQALDGNLPFNFTSNERTFLNDFIACTNGTSGGRLAAWLQPESYLEPKNCSILYNKDELRCGWPVTIMIKTKDQYGHLVNVQHLKVEVKAVPILKDMAEERRAKRLSRYDTEGSLIFGGHPPPKLDIPYQVTVKDNKDSYHAISMMKAFENYSFEELRYATPTHRRPAENMLVRDNQDGMFSANWTPGGVGFYNIHVTLDGFETGEAFKVEVKEPPQGIVPPSQQTIKKSDHQPNRLRQFVAPQSQGLRVRQHPSLQGEQIGIIEPGGIISFTSELHNNDGVWLRLSSDSIRACCNPLNGYNEGWALQYNQHLGKTLLVPVVEPVRHASTDDTFKVTPTRQPTQEKPAEAVAKFPCTYRMVKCGLSGHNIRVIPDMDSTAIGMVIKGNQLTGVREVKTAEGMWVQLDPTSIQCYCHEVEGEAWCLVQSAVGEVYLQPESDAGADDGGAAASGFGTNGVGQASSSPSKGFDFTTAAKVPSFSAFSTELPDFVGVGHCAEGGSNTEVHDADGQPIVASVSGCSSEDRSGQPWAWSPSTSSEPRSQNEKFSVADPQGKGRSASLRREESPYQGPDLQASPNASSTPHASPYPLAPRRTPEKRDPTQRTLLQFPDLPPELQGVSVKDLVKALGESRVNGNGVTPPMTPPGTPKKTLSRSSSPKAPAPVFHNGLAPSLGSNLLPRKDPTGIVAPSPSGASSSPASAVMLSPALRRVISSPSGSASGAESGFSASKLLSNCYQRSMSSSPQRSGTGLQPSLSTPIRSASVSPVRTSLTGQPLSSLEITRDHFLSGASSNSKDDPIRVAPKLSRKDRNRALRLKRDRGTNIAGKDKVSSANDSPDGTQKAAKGQETVRKAMSPSVSQCVRSVFAAFLWHEGIVHDAMACASFLKFHPYLRKEVPKPQPESSKEDIPSSAGASGGGKGSENLADQDASSSGSIKRPVNMSSKKEIGNINETAKKTESSISLPTNLPTTVEKAVKPGESLSSSGSLERRTTPLLPTLKHLVNFWEEMSSCTLKVIEENLILASPVKPIDLEKELGKEKAKPKKQKDGRHASGAGARGNLFGEAAGGLLVGMPGADKETLCELCGVICPHPVTYHMRSSHPGCGKPAGGQGYNSGGNFCGGWAGNCGDGGMGGSTWYLMCDSCRSRYMSLLGHPPSSSKDKAKKLRKKSTTSKQTSFVQVLEPHLVMKNNAMFVLELASSCNLHLPSKSTGGRVSDVRALPILSEDGCPEPSVFPPIPFMYLEQCGARLADSAFVEEDVFEVDTLKRRHKDKSRKIDHSHSHAGDSNTPRPRPKSGYVIPDGYDGKEEQEREPRWTGLSDDEIASPALQKAFQRSISELGANRLNPDFLPQGDSFVVADTARPPFSVSNNSGARRRNNSSCAGTSGLSLLKHPSAQMTRLIQSTEKWMASNKPRSDYMMRQPVMAFCSQRHDLAGLQRALKVALCKATCRVFAMQAFNWLVRQVTQLTCLHDLFWHFVSSLMASPDEIAEEHQDAAKKEKEKREQDSEKDPTVLCRHPLSDISVVGDSLNPLIQAFHNFLQTVSDVMMYLPPGSTLQQMAIRCWCLEFQPSDHVFLHRCHVFRNISKILSKSEEGWDHGGSGDGNILKSLAQINNLSDMTSLSDIKASSRQAMVSSMSDSSTETFWESGDEDKNKSKTITIIPPVGVIPRVICIHIDNARDLANKVGSVAVSAGTSQEDLQLLKQVDLEPRYAGWTNVWFVSTKLKVIKLELKGPDNTLRVRQLKLLGDIGDAAPAEPSELPPFIIQQQNCEYETLKVFRLLTSQVFGRLVNEAGNSPEDQENVDHSDPKSMEGDVDLKEHMVGILFSRSKLSQLQKQVCMHIVQAIRKETIRVQEEWEDGLTEENKHSKEKRFNTSDAYCFELLSLVLALSGSVVGRHYLAQQYSLLEDLLSLLHTSTPRVQRQVVALIRRVLLDVQPKVLAGLMGVPCLPPVDFSILSTNTNDASAVKAQYDHGRKGILDVFLACIAKAITVQTKKSKSASGKSGKNASESFRLKDCFSSSSVLPGRWWFRGSTSVQLAETIISLLKDMSDGKLTKEWMAVTKSAIAEPILALSRMADYLRNPSDCVKTPTLWLTLAALCVLSDDHVERLSSGQWVGGKGEATQSGPTCENHDDGETLAMILCTSCGNLCTECDRILHLNRKTRMHQRQVFKEEEEAIRVDLHEGCGRVKLYWLLALADSKTLKSIVEFRNGSKGKILKAGDEPAASSVGGKEPCRFCGVLTNPGLMTIGTVCDHPDCQEHAKNACAKTLPCGHACGGIRDENPCLFCLHGCAATQESLKQDADDMCMVCFTEALSAAPAIQLGCGHVFHLHCCQQVLTSLWPGPRITFGFSLCPICKAPISHTVLDPFLQPIRNRHDDVRRKALMRLEYEGLHRTEAITAPGATFFNDPAGYAMDRYAYYVCFKCKKAYYGGEARCEEQAAGADNYDPSELVCGACSDVSRAQMCARHGADFLEYKCRYCCSVAIFFCFGTTHFCNACHEDFQRVTTLPKAELPHCPAGPKAKQLQGDECPLHVVHPATGEEFALGCGVCRNAHTF